MNPHKICTIMYTHVQLYQRLHRDICTCTHLCVHICIYACIHNYRRLYIYTYSTSYACVHTYTHYTYTHYTYTHAYMYACIHTCILVCTYEHACARTTYQPCHSTYLEQRNAQLAKVLWKKMENESYNMRTGAYSLAPGSTAGDSAAPAKQKEKKSPTGPAWPRIPSTKCSDF